MATSSFEFSLQPALDKAAFERDRCADEVAGIQAQIKDERLQLGELKSQHVAVVQLARSERDNHCKALAAGAAAVDLIDGSHDLQALQRRIVRKADAVVAQQRVIDRLRVRLDVKKEELMERMERARAFEKLRERAIVEHARKLEHAEGIEIDEQALELFERRRKTERKK